MTSVSHIIDHLGGATAVARQIDVGPSTVSEWKRSQSIPVRYWKRLVDITNGAIDADTLMRVHTPPSPEKQDG